MTTLNFPRMNKDELFQEVRKAVRKAVGTALHFNKEITEDWLFFQAALSAYNYLSGGIPSEVTPEGAIELLRQKLGPEVVTVLVEKPNAIQIRLNHRTWWFKLANEGTLKECICIGTSDAPSLKFAVTGAFYDILPVLDELSDELLAVAKDEMCNRLCH